MEAYSNTDAERELRTAFDHAPTNAVKGEWFFITEQSGVSSQTGSYLYPDGSHFLSDSHALECIRDVVDKLEASQRQSFNKVIIRWKKSRIPLMRGRVTVETYFDESIVPRGPNHPVYELAAAARRAFWMKYGELSENFISGLEEANIHNQTKWFGPHRRILCSKVNKMLTLATDGLSTPWAGVAELENGVECELFMELDLSINTTPQIDKWAQLLIHLGDLVADKYQIANEVKKYGAILFCSLTDDYQPMTHVILSDDQRQIEDLPFGPIALICVTLITDVEIEHYDQSGEWASNAARHALAVRQLHNR